MEDCPERIRLTDEYTRHVAEYLRLARSKHPFDGGDISDPGSRRELLTASQHAWDALERHISSHRCLDVYPRSLPEGREEIAPAQILQKAAEAAMDVILVADDERRFVEVNEAAARILGLPRHEILGRRIEEFFSEAAGADIPAAWASFVGEGVQWGICELKTRGPRRRFEYRAQAAVSAGRGEHDRDRTLNSARRLPRSHLGVTCFLPARDLPI